MDGEGRDLPLRHLHVACVLGAGAVDVWGWVVREDGGQGRNVVGVEVRVGGCVRLRELVEAADGGHGVW